MCHGIRYLYILIQLLTNISVMYTTSIVGKAQVKPKLRVVSQTLNFPLQYSDLPWFAHNSNYSEFEQNSNRSIVRVNYSHGLQMQPYDVKIGTRKNFYT